MLPRSGPLRVLLAAVPLAALVTALLAAGSAGAETPAPAPVAGKSVVKMVLKGGKLSFEAPETV